MDTTGIEELLEELVGKQDELISRIESLELTVKEQLTEANSGLAELKGFFISDSRRTQLVGRRLFARQATLECVE